MDSIKRFFCKHNEGETTKTMKHLEFDIKEMKVETVTLVKNSKKCCSKCGEFIGSNKDKKVINSEEYMKDEEVMKLLGGKCEGFIFASNMEGLKDE